MSSGNDDPLSAGDRGPVLDKLEALLARQRTSTGAPPARLPPSPAHPADTPAAREGDAIPLLSEPVGVSGATLGNLPADGVPTLTETLSERTPGSPAQGNGAPTLPPASRESLRAALLARLPPDLERQVRERALAELNRVTEEHARTLALLRQRQATQLQLRVHEAIDRAIDEAIDRALLGSRPSRGP